MAVRTKQDGRAWRWNLSLSGGGGGSGGGEGQRLKLRPRNDYLVIMVSEPELDDQ